MSDLLEQLIVVLALIISMTLLCTYIIDPEVFKIVVLDVWNMFKTNERIKILFLIPLVLLPISIAFKLLKG
jgi:hypothetical protein